MTRRSLVPARLPVRPAGVPAGVRQARHPLCGTRLVGEEARCSGRRAAGRLPAVLVQGTLDFGNLCDPCSSRRPGRQRAGPDRRRGHDTGGAAGAWWRRRTGSPAPNPGLRVLNGARSANGGNGCRTRWEPYVSCRAAARRSRRPPTKKNLTSRAGQLRTPVPDYGARWWPSARSLAEQSYPAREPPPPRHRALARDRRPRRPAMLERRRRIGRPTR